MGNIPFEVKISKLEGRILKKRFYGNAFYGFREILKIRKSTLKMMTSVTKRDFMECHTLSHFIFGCYS